MSKIKLEGTITPAKIMSVIIFIGGCLVAIELDNANVALAAIGFSSAVYIGRKKIAQLMMKINGTSRNS